MEQPGSRHVDRCAVTRKIEATWGAAAVPEILAILDRYPGDDEAGRARVHLGILKLAGGDRSRLEDLVAMSNLDFRDVLAQAEYPEELASKTWAMAAGEVRAIRDRDRRQYLDWLTGRGPEPGGEP